MPLDLPMPNFNVAPPTTPILSPIDQQLRMLQLKALSGQNQAQQFALQQHQQLAPLDLQEKQQQLQQQQLATQKAQEDLESRHNLMQAVAGGVVNKYAGVDTPDGSGFDAAGAYKELLSGSHGTITPDMASEYVGSMQKIGQTQAETRKTLGQAGEAEQNIRDKTLNQVASKLGSIGDMKGEEAAQALAEMKADLVHDPKAFVGLTQDEKAILYGADLSHLSAIEAHLGVAAKIADFHESQYKATKAQQGIIPPTGGLSPEAQQAVAKDVAVASNPQIQAGKVAVAAAEGAARAAQEAKTARGSNAALANVPPHLVPPASSAANKAGEDYAQAQSVTQRLNAMMDAARKGNVVSYQVLPEEGTLQITTSQGVHRINKTEIDQYAGGGSLWQRLEGHFGKTLTGASIPSSVLDDMAEIQKIQSQGAQLKYNNSLKTINQTYGADFKPVEMESLSSVQGGEGGGGAKFPAGATHIVPGKDGKNHYTNEKGTVDYGIAP